jgi:hypothetical protein
LHIHFRQKSSDNTVNTNILISTKRYWDYVTTAFVLKDHATRRRSRRYNPEDPEGSTAKDSHSNNKIYAENNDNTTNSKRIATGNSMVQYFSMLISETNKTANVSAHQLKPSGPSEPSVIYVGKQNDKNDKNQNITTESVKEFKCFYCDQLCSLPLR